MGDGETYNIPIEIAEARYGVLVEEYALRCDSGGYGKYIGGSGVVRKYKALSDHQQLSVSYGRHQHAPWGENGGNEGGKSYIKILRKEGYVERPTGNIKKQPLHKSDEVE